jgi:bifunctional non-homologous end joining protein LigD
VVGKSVASAFSVRARAGATVSTPLEWNELTDDLDPSDFTIDNVIDELPKRGRIWSKSMGEGNRLDKLLKGASSAGRRSKRS